MTASRGRRRKERKNGSRGVDRMARKRDACVSSWKLGRGKEIKALYSDSKDHNDREDVAMISSALRPWLA